MKEQISRDDAVKETLYIPLLGRIYTSKYYPEFFYDEKALALEASIPKRYQKISKPEYYCLAGATRYYHLDNEVRAFIKQYPNANIVNLGAGLDTMAYRVGAGNAHFYELDLPDVIAMRRKLLPEMANETYIASSFLDLRWLEQIDTRLPTLFVASGVFHYFTREVVQTFLQDSLDKIPQLAIVFDAVDEVGLKFANRFVKKTGNHNAEMYFYINDAKAFFDTVSPVLVGVREYPFYTDARKILGNKISIKTKCYMWYVDKFNRAKIVKGGNISYD